MFRELLLRSVSSFCQLSDEQLDRLERHYQLLLRWNKTINLTRIEGQEAVNRHYAESLFLGTCLPSGHLRLADVGSGGGFPGIPIAVLRPECRVTLIESHQRKAVFLKEATRELENVVVLSARAEEVAESFDWVISRAVSWEVLRNLKLSPNAALLGTAAQGLEIPLPWEESRHVTLVQGSVGTQLEIVSRET